MTEHGQYVLPLPHRTSLGRDDYFVSSANRPALDFVEAWPAWPSGRLAVIGPEGSGKTHLSLIHAARASQANEPVMHDTSGSLDHLILDDVDRLFGDTAAEEALFHAFNRIEASGGSILLTSSTPPAGWRVDLPDLRTRLNTIASIGLPPPDDALLLAVLLKLFADLQIAPERAAAVSAWLVPRMPRSLAAANVLVKAIDERSLAQGRRIDTRLAAEILSPGLDL